MTTSKSGGACTCIVPVVRYVKGMTDEHWAYTGVGKIMEVWYFHLYISTDTGIKTTRNVRNQTEDFHEITGAY